MMWWGFCSSLGLTSTMKVNELKLYIYIYIYFKKKEKNGKLVEKIFPNRRRRVYSGDQR